MVVATAARTFSPTGASPRASFSGLSTARPNGIRSRFTFCGSCGRSATWDTKRVAMETELGAYRTAVRNALRMIEHRADGKITDVKNLLRGVHRS